MHHWPPLIVSEFYFGGFESHSGWCIPAVRLKGHMTHLWYAKKNRKNNPIKMRNLKNLKKEKFIERDHYRNDCFEMD